jgi:hypothetical protein
MSVEVKPVIMRLKLKHITVDPGLQARAAGLDSPTVDEYAADMSEGKEFPPGRVFRDPAMGTQWLSRGFHRHAAGLRAGLRALEFEVFQGTRDDAVLDAAGSNATHGLRRSADDKRRAVGMVLGVHPDWSDRRIADHVVVSHDLVAAVRRSMPTGGDSATSLRVGRDEKSYKVSTQTVIETSTSDLTAASAATSATVGNDCQDAAPTAVSGSRDSAGEVTGDCGFPQSDPEGTPDPFAVPGKVADPLDPPLDPRFMPFAADSVAVAEQFRNWRARLIGVRGELRRLFSDSSVVMAERINSGRLDAMLGEIAETFDKNVPEHVCPACCGTGDGGACKFCSGYGIVDKSFHAGMKGTWKKTRARYEALAAAAGVPEPAPVAGVA